MAVIDGGSSSAGKANVDAGYNLQVALPDATTPSRVGGVRMFSENDAEANYLKSPETSVDYRLRVGMDTVLFSDTFNGTAQNTGIWNYAAATLTATQPGGYLQFGTVQGTAVSHGAFIRSQRYFPVVGTAPLAAEFTIGFFTAALVANEVVYLGLGLPSVAGTAITDGAYFKITNAGIFGAISYNGVETPTLVFTATGSAMTLATMKRLVMVASEDEVEFWVDDVFMGEIAIPPANGQPFMAGSLPVYVQKLCTGVVANTNVVRLSDVTVSVMDVSINSPLTHQQAGQGMHIGQLQNGTAISGPLTFFANSAYPTTGLPVNTALTANLPNLLGGAGLATMWNLAATDMVMQLWLNPAGTINITGRTLFITGMTISASTATAAWTAPAAGGHVLQWWLAYGHTTANGSVATISDSSTFLAGGTTKGTRRRPIGTMSWATGATPVGTMPDRGDINVTFQVPIPVNPGEYIATVCRMMNGAVTASGGMHFLIGFDGYFQ